MPYITLTLEHIMSGDQHYAPKALNQIANRYNDSRVLIVSITP